MALSFKSNKGKSEPDAKSAKTTTPQTDDAPKSEKKKSSTLSWMKRGDAAKTMLAEEEARAEKAKQESGKMWRFWMPPDEERKVTFLDGDLDADGMLDVPMYMEHQVKVNGQWGSYVCTQESEGYCPLCDRGDSKAALVGVLTIIDHTPHKIKSGANAGKTIQDTRKLFVAKKQTIRNLSKMAVKRDGLTGCTFDVMRGDEKTASIGSQFDFDVKQSLEDLAKKHDLKLEEVQPADYDSEIIYRSGEELVELGLGKGPTGPGYESSGAKKNLSDEL